MSKIFVISAPSGTGKGTVIKEILKRDESIYFSVSMTTRAMRNGEQAGVDYHYVSKEEFLNKLDEGKILEYTEFCGNYYGTPLDILQEKLKEGRNCILELDVIGAENVKKTHPDMVSIFMAPPSKEILEKRLRGRGTESEEDVKKRLAEAERELDEQSKFDYVVINDDLMKAVLDIEKIIKEEVEEK